MDTPSMHRSRPTASTLLRGTTLNASQQLGERTDAVSRLIKHFQAGGELVAAQLPSRSTWSPEKKLAAAVLASALLHVRDHHGDVPHRSAVQDDLEWIQSDETRWPYSFIPLCHMLELEPQWVRQMVHRWMMTSGRRARQSSVHRSAA